MATKKSKSSGLFGRRQSLSGMQLLVFACVFALVGGVVSWAAFAAPANSKGGGRGGKTPYTGTLEGPVMVTDKNSDGMANWGDVVTWKVTSNALYYFVEAKCSQNGTVVYQQAAGFYPGYPWSKDFTLQSYIWTGGAADCTATLYSSKSDGSNRQNLATLNFHVNP